MNGPKEVTMMPAPISYNVSGGGMYCEGEAGVDVMLESSETGFDYELFIDDEATGNILAGTGAAITFTGITQQGLCTIEGKDPVTFCAAMMNNSVEVILVPNPASYNVTGGGEYCEGGNGVEIGLDGSETDVSYELYYNDDPTGNTVTGNGDPVSFGYLAGVGAYTVVAVELQNTCTSQMTGTANVSVIALPGVPGTPSGPDEIDLSITDITQYTTTAGANATAHEWLLEPVAAGTVATVDLTTCEVLWDMAFEGTATLKVRGVNVCGESNWSETFTVNVYNSVGFGDLQPALGIKISPNPSSGLFTLEMNTEENQVVSFRIVNSVNSLIYREEQISINRQYKQTLDLQKLPAGVYFIHIESGKKSLVKKLVIQ
jgi:hypothetical protein